MTRSTEIRRVARLMHRHDCSQWCHSFPIAGPRAPLTEAAGIQAETSAARMIIDKITKTEVLWKWRDISNDCQRRVVGSPRGSPRRRRSKCSP